MLFDWFCQWSQLMLRYQLTRDEGGMGQADMRKMVQYLAEKAPQPKVLNMQRLGAQRQKLSVRLTLTVSCFSKPLLVQGVLPGRANRLL